MNTGRFILSQVLDLVHRQTLERLVNKYKADCKVRHFGCRQQLICMAFTQLTWREGLRDIAEHRPRRIPSRKWRELIKKVWEADPLLCPRCGEEMRIVALVDEASVIERILRHLGLWEEGIRVDSSRGPPPPITETIIEPYLDDPFPDYENEAVFC